MEDVSPLLWSIEQLEVVCEPFGTCTKLRLEWPKNQFSTRNLLFHRPFTFLVLDKMTRMRKYCDETA